MRVSKHKCDTCGREHEDVSSFKGWMEVQVPGDKDGSIIMRHGRDKKNHPIHKEIALKNDMDFCSRKCFDKFIDERLGG